LTRHKANVLGVAAWPHPAQEGGPAYSRSMFLRGVKQWSRQVWGQAEVSTVAVLSEYEKQAYEQVKERKARLRTSDPRRWVPPAARDAVQRRGKQIAGRLREVPGFVEAAERARAGYVNAIGGVTRMTTRATQLTLSEGRMLRAYDRKGYPLKRLADIRWLDLEVVEKQARPRYLDFVYASTAAAEGPRRVP